MHNITHFYYYWWILLQPLQLIVNWKLQTEFLKSKSEFFLYCILANRFCVPFQEVTLIFCILWARITFFSSEIKQFINSNKIKKKIWLLLIHDGKGISRYFFFAAKKLKWGFRKIWANDLKNIRIFWKKNGIHMCLFRWVWQFSCRQVLHYGAKTSTGLGEAAPELSEFQNVVLHRTKKCGKNVRKQCERANEPASLNGTSLMVERRAINKDAFVLSAGFCTSIETVCPSLDFFVDSYSHTFLFTDKRLAKRGTANIRRVEKRYAPTCIAYTQKIVSSAQTTNQHSRPLWPSIYKSGQQTSENVVYLSPPVCGLQLWLVNAQF